MALIRRVIAKFDVSFRYLRLVGAEWVQTPSMPMGTASQFEDGHIDIVCAFVPLMPPPVRFRLDPAPLNQETSRKFNGLGYPSGSKKP